MEIIYMFVMSGNLFIWNEKTQKATGEHSIMRGDYDRVDLNVSLKHGGIVRIGEI